MTEILKALFSVWRVTKPPTAPTYLPQALVKTTMVLQSPDVSVEVDSKFRKVPNCI